MCLTTSSPAAAAVPVASASRSYFLPSAVISHTLAASFESCVYHSVRALRGTYAAQCIRTGLLHIFEIAGVEAHVPSLLRPRNTGTILLFFGVLLKSAFLKVIFSI